MTFLIDSRTPLSFFAISIPRRGQRLNSHNAVTKDKAAEIAADFMTTFYHEQVSGLETQVFRTCFSNSSDFNLASMVNIFIMIPWKPFIISFTGSGCKSD